MPMAFSRALNSYQSTLDKNQIREAVFLTLLNKGYCVGVRVRERERETVKERERWCAFKIRDFKNNNFKKSN